MQVLFFSFVYSFLISHIFGVYNKYNFIILYWFHIRQYVTRIFSTIHTLTNAAESLFQYNSDDIIRQRCRAREDYERHERTVNKKIQDLTQALEESENTRQSYQQHIVELEAQPQAHGIQP